MATGGLKRANIYLLHHGVRRFLCTISFVKNDASLYLIPADDGFVWHAGRRDFDAGQNSLTFDTTEGP
jgi:hypothetical protein